MSTPNLDQIHPELREVATKAGIEEKDVFFHNSDVYLGCKDRNQAHQILNGGKWEVMSSVFSPNKGSDMGHYTVAVDVGFGRLDHCVANNIKPGE